MMITQNKKKKSQALLNNSERICVGSKHKGDYVTINDILYVEAYQNYSWLHLKDGKKLLSCKPIGYYEGLFTTASFARIHRSYLANLSYVKTYDKGYRLLHLKGNITLSVSHRKKDHFSKIIDSENNTTFSAAS